VSVQPSDRVRARIEAQAQLRDAAARFVASCADVSDGQWVFQPSPAAWSMAQRGDEPPNVATPSGAWTDRQLAIERFDANAGTLLEWADGTDADLRAVGLEHPVFGLLDGVQWLHFAEAHIERHRAQLLGLVRGR
jgi:hypothetical protein